MEKWALLTAVQAVTAVAAQDSLQPIAQGEVPPPTSLVALACIAAFAGLTNTVREMNAAERAGTPLGGSKLRVQILSDVMCGILAGVIMLVIAKHFHLDPWPTVGTVIGGGIAGAKLLNAFSNGLVGWVEAKVTTLFGRGA